MSLRDRDQWEVHCLQGFGHFHILAVPAWLLFHMTWVSVILGAGTVLSITAFWEVPEWRRGGRFEAFSDALQRVVGMGLAIISFWVLA